MDAYPPPSLEPRDEIIDVLSRVEVSCPRCGYSLRGLQHATCPECGEPVDLDEIEDRLAAGRWGFFRSPVMFAFNTMVGLASFGLVAWGGGVLFLLWLTLALLWVNVMFIWLLEVFWFKMSAYAWAPACVISTPLLLIAACTRLC